MSAVRVAKYFSFVDFKRQMKVNLSAIGKIYCVAALLQNAHTCTSTLYPKPSNYNLQQLMNTSSDISHKQVSTKHV